MVEENSLKYLEWLRKKPYCVVSMKKAVELHHVEALEMGANRDRQNNKHYTAIPLSSEVHRDIHKLDRSAFQKKYGFPGTDIFVHIWKTIHKYNLEYFEEKYGKV